MEALSDVLQPYKDVVGKAAAIVTVAQMFSGCFLCYDIYKKGNTRGVPIMPFVGGFIMSVINLKYGTILRDRNIINVNLVGLALNIIYLVIFFRYAEQKIKVWAQMGAGGFVSAAMIGYSEYEDPALVENRFGLIITAFMFYLISSPLFDLKKIIKNKSTEGMPFPIILSGTVVTCSWLLYGIILKNNFMILQNVVAFVLCAIQLSLFVIYPSKPAKPAKKVKAKKED